MTKTIDVTRTGKECDICESVVNIPQIEREISYIVRLAGGLTYGRVYPKCKHAIHTHHDPDGDVYCNELNRWCGMARIRHCPFKNPGKGDDTGHFQIVNGQNLDFAEYCKIYGGDPRDD